MDPKHIGLNIDSKAWDANAKEFCEWCSQPNVQRRKHVHDFLRYKSVGRDAWPFCEAVLLQVWFDGLFRQWGSSCSSFQLLAGRACATSRGWDEMRWDTAMYMYSYTYVAIHAAMFTSFFMYIDSSLYHYIHPYLSNWSLLILVDPHWSPTMPLAPYKSHKEQLIKPYKLRYAKNIKRADQRHITHHIKPYKTTSRSLWIPIVPYGALLSQAGPIGINIEKVNR